MCKPKTQDIQQLYVSGVEMRLSVPDVTNAAFLSTKSFLTNNTDGERG